VFLPFLDFVSYSITLHYFADEEMDLPLAISFRSSENPVSSSLASKSLDILTSQSIYRD
jgi:hypothetical protein